MILFMLLFGLLSSTHAAPREITRAFCHQRLATPRSLQTLIKNDLHQLARSNQGGLLNGGVCWWHSRFTRNAAYLARFRPELPKPSRAEGEELVMRLRRGEAIVDIPGYTNLSNFSYDYADEIQERLEAWQLSDGVLRFQWVRGLSGTSSVAPAELERGMDDLYRRVQRGEIVYQMMQFDGPLAHAWLVVDMVPTPQGYNFNVVDSIFAARTAHSYRRGQRSFTRNGDPFVPYTQHTDEEARLRELLRRECREYLRGR